ncbi:fumarylacetoacetate hydrolase family protein [Hoeflea prorocentri]|uniref:Fumarylacetoacetate hydrolase family protein n=1 Tax=Hoeflea prorocentri TaxID=1922333 RepID=A0A9X3UDV5_9HYPH|nr:fumarylacetoacetate hydrolase family protein [Hoeflea prorocentri]MCY6379487.1 fumarylacetoacetate hydrolase family protein [Hoeflea prorocentri]MDA5397287.1 fumarylacetoacetate hydrolase family protein [Hoeflea prorocentri]
MKLLRVGREGSEIPCMLDDTGTARDVSPLVADFTPQTIPLLADTLGNTDPTTLEAVETAGARIGTPMTQPRNIYCIGLNYSDHAAEAGMDIPEEPILFNKASGTFCAPNDPILYSPKMSKLDWEVELGIVIGTAALNVERENALDHVLGYTVVNDVSERSWQLERGGQWAKGKGFPNFCPTGPWIVTGDEVADARALPMWLDVNGQRMQSGNTNTMIFDVATIVSYLSEFMRLEPGDLICTGTPPGVGAGMKPPVWLGPGDNVSLGIDGLGEQQQRVVNLSEVAA